MATMLGIRTEGDALPRVIELEERPVCRRRPTGGCSSSAAPPTRRWRTRSAGTWESAAGGPWWAAFKNEETRVRIEENVRGADVFVIQSTCSPVDHHIMELLLMIDALRRASADRVTAVIPYYGYAKQEKKTAGREPISAKLVANLIATAGADRVVAIDLHAAGHRGLLRHPGRPPAGQPVDGRRLPRPHRPTTSEIVVVSPDSGGVARANDFRAARRRAPGDHRQAAPPAGHGRGAGDGRRRAGQDGRDRGRHDLHRRHADRGRGDAPGARAPPRSTPARPTASSPGAPPI